MKRIINYISSFGIILFLLKMILKILEKIRYRGKIYIKINNIKHSKMNKYLIKKYGYLLKKCDITTIDNKIENDIIWLFWYQGIENAPLLVKKCVESIERECNDYKIIIISKDNIDEYYQTPSYIKEKLENNQITLTHFSDILRMNLLSKYGGYWMDATIYLTDNPFENSDFYTIKYHCKDNTNISFGRWCGFFIGGNNPILYNFMSNFFNEYWKKEKVIIDYFLIDYAINMAYENINEINKTINKVPYNNENILKLQTILNEQYNKKDYEKLIKNNAVHKLSFKTKFDNNKDTFYNRIINKIGDCNE